MQPEDQQVPSGIDYLNQISTPPKSSGSAGRKKFIISGIIIGAMLIASVLLLTTAKQQSPGASPIKIAARLQKLQTVNQAFSKKLRGTAVQDASSSLGAILLTANQSITEPIKSYGVDMSKQSKDFEKLDPSEVLTKRLDEAYLNYQLDDTYAREMYFQIEDTMAMVDTVYSKTNNQVMKDYLKKTYEDLNGLKKRFAKIVGAEEG